MDSLNSIDKDFEAQVTITEDHTDPKTRFLSKRGQSNNDKLGPMIPLFASVFADSYDPETNPDGLINAGIAENSLNWKLVQDYYANLKIDFTDLTYGDGLGASQRLKTLYAEFINRQLEPTHKLTKESVFVGSGVGGCIDALAYNICNPGDGIMVAEPYYNGFDIDFTVRASAVPVGVKLDHLESPFSYKALEAFEATYLAKRKEGIACKAVMLCNPQNPLGRCYPRSTLREYIRFCKKYDLWLISDEIYAFSIFDTTELLEAAGEDKGYAPYHSILTFTDDELDGFDKVCFLHGMSKDFCANGFRMGCLCLPFDTPLRVAMSVTSILGKVSSLTDIAFSKILEDKAFLNEFLDGNKKKMGDAYAFFIIWAQKHGIRYTSSCAGHFVVLDLRPFLNLGKKWRLSNGSGSEGKQDGWADEAALQQMLIKDHKLFVANGAVYHFSEPGFFRWTFTMRSDFADVALSRLAKGLGL